MKEGTLVWCDLETTGLSEREDCILEVGMVITDDDLVEIAAKDWLVRGNWDLCDDCVLKMHERSGLLQDHKNNIKFLKEYPEIEKEMIEFLLSHCQEGEAVLANTSVHFDKRFLSFWMPAFTKKLHYRLLDVSSFRRAIRIMTKGKVNAQKPKAAHRALGDARQAIREFKDLHALYKAWCKWV